MSKVINKLCPFPRKNLNRIMQIWSVSTPRYFATRKDCPVYDGPRCAKEKLAKLPPCPGQIRRIEAKENAPYPNTMWETHECCVDQCPEFEPRFDELYYKVSDKINRKYQQTWVGCPKLRLKPKLICETENLEYPQLEKRSIANRPKTACPVGGSRICVNKKKTKCPRVSMPKCQGCRNPPKCKTERKPKKCQKECTPYPSYSECLRDPFEPADPQECKCLDLPYMCEVWAEMKRRDTFLK